MYILCGEGRERDKENECERVHHAFAVEMKIKVILTGTSWSLNTLVVLLLYVSTLKYVHTVWSQNSLGIVRARL